MDRIFSAEQMHCKSLEMSKGKNYFWINSISIQRDNAEYSNPSVVAAIFS